MLARLTWRTVPMLLVAALLAGGHRTVAAAHHQMGLDETANFGLCHHVFSCVRWSALDGYPRLLVVVVRTFVGLASVRQIENHSIVMMLTVHRITQSDLSVVRRPYDHTLGLPVIPQRVLHAAVPPDSLLSPMAHRLPFRRMSRTLLAFVSAYGRPLDVPDLCKRRILRRGSHMMPSTYP